MIKRAERIGGAAGRNGQNGIGVGVSSLPGQVFKLGRFTDERGEEFRRKSGHVTRGDQDPGRRAGGEGSFNTTQGPDARVKIGDHGTAKGGMASGITDNCSRTADAFDDRRNVFAERGTAKRQQRFVGAHSTGLATGQNEARNKNWLHQLAPLASLRVAAIIKANTFMRISLVTAATVLTALAAGPVNGAARSAGVRASVKNPTSVVRVSPQGRLVRTVLTPATPERPKPAAVLMVAAQADVANSITTMSDFDAMVETLAAEHRVDPLLVHAVIRVESNYNQFAMSDKGAQGYMQLIPQTAREMGVRNAFDPRENITGGVKYLRAMMDRFSDLRHAIAAYNAGPEAVERFGGIPPYTETQNYVYLVADQYNRLRREHPPVAPAQVAETRQAAPEPEHRPLTAYVDADGRLHMETTQ